MELEETPPSPVGRAVLWTIILFFAAALGWAWLGHVDIVTVAHGKIIPSGRVKVIQPLETAVVRRVLVSEGQAVEQDQVLVELDTTISAADKARIANELHAARLDKTRVEALLGATRSLAEPVRLVPPVGATQAEVQLTERRLDRAHAEHLANLTGYEAQRRQGEAEHAATRARVEQLDATIPLITEQTQAIKRLLAQSHAARAQWLELERERIEQLKQREIQTHLLVMQQAAVDAAEQRQRVYQTQRQSRLLSELSALETRVSSYEKELIKAHARHALQHLKAPTAGVVQQLAVNTVGGVVTPAQMLMHVVPNQGLVVEAWVENKDIGFVREGQSTAVKVDAFPFTKYGTIDGEIVMLSDDAIAHESLGLVYAAHLELSRSTVGVDGKTVPLSPGMTVTVEVKTGERRVVEFLLAPLLRGLSETARER